MTNRIVNDMTVQELVAGFKKEPMQFAPGAQYRYNRSHASIPRCTTLTSANTIWPQASS
jgi:hypothetical protein